MERTSHRNPQGINDPVKPLILAALTLAVTFAGCVQSGEGVEISHVHGMAYEPGQGAAFVATHQGLARGVPDDGSWSWGYVGSDRYDYMGFTQDAERPGVFYSSGHPSNAREYGGVHLGLRRSVDAGESWEQRSLKGEVDFHALTSIPGRDGWLAGAWQGAIKVSTDGGLTWTDHPAPPAQVLALAGAQGRLLAGTRMGLYEARDLEAFTDWVPVKGEGSPSFVSAVAASPGGWAIFVSTGNTQVGSTYRSLDGGATWAQLSPPALRDAAAPAIFAVDPLDSAHVFASTSDALVMESMDQGATWATIRQP